MPGLRISWLNILSVVMSSSLYLALPLSRSCGVRNIEMNNHWLPGNLYRLLLALPLKALSPKP